MGLQAPSAIVAIRPHHFLPNPATASDNRFQVVDSTRDAAEIARAAHREASVVIDTLVALGVTVHAFDDERDDCPDSVFPNNWFSTHAGGHVAIYPMYAQNRRTERRQDIIETLKQQYRVQEVVDFSGLEVDNIFLEGTGAMVLDHASRLAFAARSNRANPIALERFCTRLGYEPVGFDAFDRHGAAVYHTNVMMSIATDFALVGLDMIVDEEKRDEVAWRLAAPGRDVIALDHRQIESFAGNAIELQATAGRILAMSSRAAMSLRVDQRAVIERSAAIVALDIPTIELAGGSVRCMIAGLHLERRPVAVALTQSSVA